MVSRTEIKSARFSGELKGKADATFRSDPRLPHLIDQLSGIDMVEDEAYLRTYQQNILDQIAVAQGKQKKLLQELLEATRNRGQIR